MKQCNYKKVNDNKNIEILVVKNKKITIIIISTILMSRKLLIIWTKIVLLENK